MQQRTALIVAATITAFTLVVVGGVAARVAQPSAAATTAATAASVALVASPTADTSAQAAYLQQMDAYYQQREAAYQQLVKQANQQLQDAYRQITLAKKRVRAPVKPAPTAQPTAAPYAVTPQQAAGIALAAAPGTSLLATPEVVSFQGAVAYEVHLDRGLVYIDATTGSVLYNGVPAQQTASVSVSQNQPPASTPPAATPTKHGDDGGNGGGGDD